MFENGKNFTNMNFKQFGGLALYACLLMSMVSFSINGYTAKITSQYVDTAAFAIESSAIGSSSLDAADVAIVDNDNNLL